MATPQKIQIVEETQKRFENSNGIYFTKYTGLSVAQATDLRDKFREKGVFYKVTKNTLTKIAAKNSGYENVDDFLENQIGIAYSESDPSAPAKVIKEFNKNGGSVEVVGVLFEGKRFEGSQFELLANLPSREDLYVKLLNGLSQPMTKLASTLSGAMTKFMYTLENLKQSKS